MTGTPILSSRGGVETQTRRLGGNAGRLTHTRPPLAGVATGPRELKPGALIIAAHYASVLNRSCHERSSQDVLPSVIRGLSKARLVLPPREYAERNRRGICRDDQDGDGRGRDEQLLDASSAADRGKENSGQSLEQALE